MIVTFQQETLDFWKEQGFDGEFQYDAEGYEFWAIDVPAEHKMLTSPEYLELILKEQKAYPEMIRTRFKPPMYIVIMDNRVAMTPTQQEGQPMAMPIAKDLPLLRSIFLKPERNQQPKFMKLKRPNQIVNAMREVRQFGVQLVAYYMTDDKVETFKIDTIAPIIKPRVQLIGADVGETAPEDEEVQPVPTEEDVQPGGSG